MIVVFVYLLVNSLKFLKRGIACGCLQEIYRDVFIFFLFFVFGTAKVRRLYDIANVLCSLSLIEKVCDIVDVTQSYQLA